jgi:Fic-DOC domain mobile mystery protein B
MGGLGVDDFSPLPSQTPIDADELAALIPGHLRLLSELNEFESANISRAIEKYFYGRRKTYDLCDPEVLRRLHKDMFGETWKWAGQYRRSNKNLGRDWWLIPEEVKKSCEDLKYWQDNKTFDPVEIAVRFHHRLVVIHPFPNGNGRHARIAADLLVRMAGAPSLSWGGTSLGESNDQRRDYIAALRQADQGNFESLLAFARD